MDCGEGFSLKSEDCGLKIEEETKNEQRRIKNEKRWRARLDLQSEVFNLNMRLVWRRSLEQPWKPTALAVGDASG